MFYEQFSKLCEANNIKQTTLARKIGLSSSAPSYWRNGSIPQSDTVQKIANYFGVSVDSLLSNDAAKGLLDIKNSVVIQGNSGNNTVSNVIASKETDVLTEQEREVLRIFRSLDMRAKTSAMNLLYELEDQKK